MIRLTTADGGSIYVNAANVASVEQAMDAQSGRAIVGVSGVSVIGRGVLAIKGTPDHVARLIGGDPFPIDQPPDPPRRVLVTDDHRYGGDAA